MLKSYVDYRHGGKPRHYIARKPISSMIIPEGLLKTVAFICYQDNQGNIRFAGIAFFVRYIDKESGLGFGYTVTALHVLRDMKDVAADGIALLRLNKRGGGYNYLSTQISDWIGANQEQEFTDIAILEWLPDSKFYDALAIGEDLLATQDMINNQQVGIGNEMVIVGLFVNHSGTRQNIPIIRYGNIAMIPDEQIKTRYGHTTGYLIESRSIGGLSGSPVFAWTDISITRETPTGSISSQMILWLGLIHGHYEIKEPVTDMLVEDTIKREAINMGVAIVVPAFKVIQTIHENSSLQESRKKRIEDEDDSNLPVADSVHHDKDMSS